MSRIKTICLVGEAFGREEEKQGRPFVGQSGKLLDQALGDLGLKRHDVYITNVCMFRPQDELGNNRPPTEEEIIKEYDRLKADTQNFYKVILLGKVAHKTLSPSSLDSFSDVLGVGQTSGFQTFYSVWHPAYVLRNINRYEEWLKQLKKALK